MVRAIKAMEIGTLSDSVETKTLTAPLTCVSGVNIDYSASLELCLVVDESLQLIEAPVVEPVSLFLADSTSPYTFYVFHSNCVSNIAFGDYCLADFVVALLDEAFLPSRNLLQEPSGTSCAFALQPSPQISVSGLYELDSIGVEELPVGCNCNIVYSDIHPMKSVRIRWDGNVSGKRYVQEHPVSLFVVDELGSLVSPVEIFPVVSWDCDWDVNPTFRSCEPDLFRTECKCPSVKVQRHIFLKDRFTSFVGLDGFKCLGSYSYGIYNELGRKFELASHLVVGEMMQFVSVSYITFETLTGDVFNSFGILLHSSEKQFILRDFQFNGHDGFHTDKEYNLVNKPYGCVCLVEVKGNSPLTDGVSLPYLR